MSTIAIIREILETHQPDDGTRQMHQDRPGYTQKCTGCPWIGWDHTLHIAKIIDEALEAPLITTVEQLRTLRGHELAGPLIKSLGLVNPDSGRYDLGEVYEQNSDGTWCLLQATNDIDDAAVPMEDLVLPAVLLWEPTRQR